MFSKKSKTMRLFVAVLVLTSFVPVTSFADDGIAQNDEVITQPQVPGVGEDRSVTGPSTAPTDGDLAKSNEENTVATDTEVSSEPPVVPISPAEDPAVVTEPTAKPSEDPAAVDPKNTGNTEVASQDPATPSVNVNGQPVVTVSPAAPVVTAGGQTVIATQDSQVIIANTDGTSSVVAPEVAGFTVNRDGTLTGKNDKGQEVTLPKTGEASTTVLTIMGSLMLALAAFFGFKKKA